MAAMGKRVTVSNAPVVLVNRGMRATIKNRDATNSVDLGGATVAAGAGYELKTGESLEVFAGADDVYAIRTAGADVRVDVLETRNVA